LLTLCKIQCAVESHKRKEIESWPKKALKYTYLYLTDNEQDSKIPDKNRVKIGRKAGQKWRFLKEKEGSFAMFSLGFLELTPRNTSKKSKGYVD